MSQESVVASTGSGGPVLVTGAAGQLGTYLRQALATAGITTLATGSKLADGIDAVVDIGDRDAVMAAFEQHRPSVVIHAAAWTDVDGCERDPDRADAVNHIGARTIAEAAREHGAWVLAVGTDFVFAGDGGAPFTERAEPDPVSVYGASKLAGERAVLETDPAFCVARTAWVYGGAGKSFPRTVLTVVRDRGGMDVVDDEVGNPTFAGDLADALVELVPLQPAGILHLTNTGTVSRFEFARSIVGMAGGNPESIHPTTTAAFLENYPLPAKRPANSSLQNIRAAGLGVELPTWQDANRRYIPVLAKEVG